MVLKNGFKKKFSDLKPEENEMTLFSFFFAINTESVSAKNGNDWTFVRYNTENLTGGPNLLYIYLWNIFLKYKNHG